MFDVPGLDRILGPLIDSTAGTAFDALVAWMAKGLGVLIEWIWSTLDAATTPRLTEPWFARDLLGPIVVLALAVTIAMMMASGIQAALAGRPEQIVDAFKHGAWSLVATSLAVTIIDLLLGVVDEAAASVWHAARVDLRSLLEGVIKVMQAGAIRSMGFLAVLMLLLMYLAMIGLAVALAMRNALIYVTAALAPLVFASSVLPIFRESARKIVHLGVSLIVSKLAIVITLTLAVKMMANSAAIEPTGDDLKDAGSALGLLFAGVVCFAVASITPLVLYKLMPTVEGAVVGAGIAGGWGRGAMTGMYAASTAKNLGGGVARLAKGGVPAPSSNRSSPMGGSPAERATPDQASTARMSSATKGGSPPGTGGAASAAVGTSGAVGAVAVPLGLATAGVSATTGGVRKIAAIASDTSNASTSSGRTATPPAPGVVQPRRES